MITDVVEKNDIIARSATTCVSYSVSSSSSNASARSRKNGRFTDRVLRYAARVARSMAFSAFPRLLLATAAQCGAMRFCRCSESRDSRCRRLEIAVNHCGDRGFVQVGPLCLCLIGIVNFGHLPVTQRTIVALCRSGAVSRGQHDVAHVFANAAADCEVCASLK